MRFVPISRTLASLRASAKPLYTRGFAAAPTHTVNVPSMGDSISEGTVVEIVKNQGDHVQSDDIVVVLETDKVSVDVRTPATGTILEHFHQIDDTVTVGAPLFQMEVNDDVPVPAQEPVKEATPEQPPAASIAPASSVSRAREPLIRFLGKRSLLPRSTEAVAAAVAGINVPVREGTIEFTHLESMFGHLAISEDEIDAVNSGVHFL